jgi:hypothetical protein
MNPTEDGRHTMETVIDHRKTPVRCRVSYEKTTEPILLNSKRFITYLLVKSQ